MVKINSVRLILSSIALLLLAIYGLYVSATNYIDYFLMKDKIFFSFQTGFFGFGSPIIIYLSSFGFTYVYRKKIKKTKNKTASYLTGIAIAGIVFSFFFSSYVQIDLTSKGYFTCYKSSVFASNEYVISKDMCK